MSQQSRTTVWLIIIALLVVAISVLHYSTPTMKWQYHLVYMQAYFIPIILAAFQFGVRGGLGTAMVVSVIYLPHIMLQWGGLVENNLMRFLQIILFNVLGWLTGLKAQGERREKEKYQQAATELRQALELQKQQSEAISQMEQQLRAADRLAIVGELTASLAHEVRNPLASIRGAVEIIRDAVPENVKQMEFFDILIQDTERLNRVVENYLGFAANPSHQSAAYDAGKILRDIVLMLGPQARRQKVRFQLEIDEHIAPLRGDANHFWQTALNVILNALQATTQEGTVRISLKGISLSDKPYTQLLVEDSGAGMNSEQLQEIFKPLFTTKQNGTGLGLAIVRRIADEHNWEIDVHSQPGQGTRFELLIPKKGKENNE